MTERRAGSQVGGPTAGTAGARRDDDGVPWLLSGLPPFARTAMWRRTPGHRGDGRPDLLWRVTVVSVAITLLWSAIAWVVRATVGPEYSLLSHAMSAVLTSLLVVPMIALARRHLDQRPWSGLGLTGLSAGWRHLLLGMAVWLVPAGVGTALCVAFGWTEITMRASVPEALGFTALLVVLVLFYEAIPEELAFRGYLQRNLMTEMSPGGAVLVQAGLFCLFGSAVWAILGEQTIDVARSLILLAAGIVLGGIRVVSRNTWACVGFHLAFQVAAQLLLAPANGQFAVSDPLPLQLVAFGFLPFGLAVLLYQIFHPAPVNWRIPEPDRKP
ncbi:CPBP family intramembrane metalloprotease domain-containing protein [Nocardiopsis gilva YIM 90087]|uniref:CPBP family intramembrane metalloprotease domain-containing protein n=1 Tax=Nocardiopsis gilva YIM 90087 TaxID=1235441 RepID=A0A223S276_9ACTN|nr:type II CAAX endopeptidase family protein [Nocardiopsis gilva]ASU82240.1 CPBP family intramembrane metalloprotease domain-containing protein [Nocardiopsis gilva YIM 90087]